MAADDQSLAEKIRRAMLAQREGMTVKEIARAVFGRAGSLECGRVYVTVHRMNEDGLVEKREATFKIKPEEARKMRRVFVRG